MYIKPLTLLLILAPFFGLSQSEYEEEAKAFFWGENDAYKNSMDTPEDWKDESAIIIYKNENYDFHKYGKRVTYTTSIRKRIKLLDLAAVEEFSEFAFKKRFRSNKGRYTWQAKGNNVIGVKIVKPDGKEKIIDVEAESIEVDGETKLAISNLEVGDIIDYYFYKVEPFKSTYAFGFDPVETTLGEEYPIMDYKLFFETENDFFINFKSFNGAPNLEQLKSNEKNVRRYKLEATNIEKNDFPRWSYPLNSKPAYKFQVYFARSGKFENKAMAFLPKDETTIKTSVSQAEVLDLYDTRFYPEGKLGDVRRYFKTATFKNNEELVAEVYYFMRHYYLTRFIEAFYVKEANIMYSPFVYYANNPVFIQSQKQFIKHFTAFLRKDKIPYEIVVAKKRYDGSIDNLLIERNVEVIVKVLTDTPLYASFFGPHTSINEFSALLENTDVYLLSASKISIDKIENGKLPLSNYENNEFNSTVKLNMNSDFSGFAVEIVNKYKGHPKTDEQYERMSFKDYVHEDYVKYETKPFIDYVKRSKREKYQKEIDALAKKIKERQKERYKERHESEYNLPEVNDYDFEINNTGRYGFDSYFVFTETYNFKDALIKKAGPNYIIEIGKFIGGQVEIEDDERERTVNIEMAYPRTIKNKIVLKIPDGFTVVGLDKLKTTVENETGVFASEAKIEDKNLIINTTKTYKHNFEPHTNWNKMLAFLDAAYQFTNKKVMLKKL